MDYVIVARSAISVLRYDYFALHLEASLNDFTRYVKVVWFSINIRSFTSPITR